MQGDGGNGRVALGKDDGGKVDGVALRCRQWEWPFSIRFLLGIVVLLGQRLHVFVVVVLVLLVHGHGGVVVGARIGVVRGGRDGGAGGGVLGRRWWDVPLRWGVGEGGGLSQHGLANGLLCYFAQQHVNVVDGAVGGRQRLLQKRHVV